ncbi:NAD dependent epimerase/dehydratase family protein [Alloalcanivorax dieselolei B5]|uniref:NAD dependent epimerase/dehydratase family protein n=1 Tax=Alcanivorax dieselolei (strain DSM 16502 / CGMCC 1.3690 / MCCC 1A00001 / B-5) TaxID=930169 RepID=K0CCY7_ALCDB|nr:NAD dependent epimerase/dehydratase [Alloalcanivorax dieselolei]AFT69542.1 NAD dependent epimerase/dehydratase family protein [Alloalcanivorax dieselolei B5]GGK04401.1 hypothetical protein GCM10007426_36580 [Alloalcanivorax dieselolei]
MAHGHSVAGLVRSKALEAGLPGTVYHAIADPAVRLRDIAGKIADRLGLPAEHFGGFARMVGAHLAASSVLIREALGWTPVGPTLMENLDEPGYVV